MRVASIALLLIALGPATAGAQDVVVLSLGGDAPSAVAREAREAVAAAIAAGGDSVMPDADLALQVPPARLAECRASACAYGISREVGASMVAAVATWMTDGAPSSLTVSLIVGPDRSHTATEEVGEAGLAAAARGAVEAAQASRRRALLIEGTSTPEPEAVETPDRPEIDPALGGERDDSPLHSERSLEEWILPSLLGVMGLGLIGVSVYAMLDASCDVRGASGVCLAGSEPNYGLGVTFAVVGGLSIAGALLWLIMGGQPPQMEDIDVVTGPGGGAVRF